MDQQISLSVYGIEAPSTLLEKMLQDKSADSEDWLRAAMRVTEPHESLYCLGCALYLNPRSETVQQALEAFEQAYAPVSVSLFERIRAFVFKRLIAKDSTALNSSVRAETFARI